LGEIKINSARRTCCLILISLLFLLNVASPLSASPLQDRRKEESDIKNRIKQVNSNLAESVKEYEAVYVQLTQINVEIQDNLVKLERTKENLARTRNVLGDRVDCIYRNGNLSLIAVILGARDFQSFLFRLDYLMKICEKDAKTLKKIESLKQEQEDRDAKLAENKTEQRVILNKVKSEKTNLERALKQKQDLLASVTTEIKALEEEERRREEEERKRALAALAAANQQANAGADSESNNPSSNTQAFVPDSSFTFPVAQPYTYCDTWHAPRPGGRLHQGTDIFALRGTQARACVNGTILRLSTGKLGGIGVTLQDKNGNTYYYGHLDGYASGVYEGMPVSAGQIIGYVGDTGNAQGTPPHVHFEIHPGGGSAINPYPILRIVI